MLTINPIQNSNYHRLQLNNKKRMGNNIEPLRSCQANSDIAFTGGYGIQRIAQRANARNIACYLENLTGCVAKPIMAVQANKGYEELIKRFSSRKDPEQNFLANDIENIRKSITPKNCEYLEKVLSFKDGIFNAAEVVSLLDYLSKEDTNGEEFSEKMRNLENLDKIIENGFDYRESVLPKYIDEVPTSGLIDLLKQDILLRKPKHNFNPLVVSYNNVVKVFEHQLRKKEVKPDNVAAIDFQAKDFMKTGFSDLLVLGMIFDTSACNELFYNRGLYVKPNYMPRLRMLNDEDLALLRKVQRLAVTEKENKGGDLSVYEISLDDKISMLDLLAANREIIKSGNKGLDFKNYFASVNTNNASGNFKINFQDLKRDLTHSILKRIGVAPGVVEKYAADYETALKDDPALVEHRNEFWDINYSHLLNAPKNSLLRDIILNATQNNFNNWIFREGFVNSSTAPISDADEGEPDFIAELYDKKILNPRKDRYTTLTKDKLNEVIGLYRRNQLDPTNRKHNVYFEFKNEDYIETLYKLKMFSVINEMNKREFEKAGINYDAWLNPTVRPITKRFINRDGRRDKEFTVKLWNREPRESLFDGNYTTCCTGIDKDQGRSFLSYMTNTCSTTMEVRTEKNKVVAMSRILMGNVDGKLSMIVENIEVNNKIAKHYLYDDKTKYKFREMIFDYARNFAKSINKTDKEIPVYFCGIYRKVTDIDKGLEPSQKYDDASILGNFENKFYINSYGGQWDRTIIHDDGDGFNLKLHNITKKAPAPKTNSVDADSDSNYNHADLSDYK